MGAKRIAFDADARAAVRRGVQQLARAVKVTLGPRGRNVMIEKGFGGPLVTKDGVTVAKEIELTSPWENVGAQLVKEVASKTSDTAGDGTTTATVLAEAIFERGQRALQAGVRPVHLKRGLEKASARVIEALRAQSTKVSGTTQIQQVGTIAANNDPEIGAVLAQALEKVGRDGVITVDEGQGIETTIDFVDGMSFDKGYLSPYFITDAEAMTAVLEDARILLYDGKISVVKDLVPVLEATLQAQKPLLIVAEELEGEALALLVVNRLRGALKVCAVKSPGFGDRRRAMLEDIAVLTGGRVVTRDVGLTLEGVRLADLGQAGKVVVRKDETLIVDGGGQQAEVKSRLAQLRAELEATTSSYDREKLEERVAKLSGGVARVLVGAATETEMKEKKARVEDAIHATRAAVEEGVLPGGGVALLRASRALDGLELEGDEVIGARIIREALEAPLRQIAQNAGVNPSIVVGKVLEGQGAFGLNAQTMEYGDLIAQGVIDPTKVTRMAFESASSVSTLLLTTDAVVCEAEAASKVGAPGAHGEGMDDLGDMGY
ncbi:MAG: chaperonin GroEL [Planctomycetes bacterium]|nr:chaperonin GroEL [Planctomycetota bacterium]